MTSGELQQQIFNAIKTRAGENLLLADEVAKLEPVFRVEVIEAALEEEEGRKGVSCLALTPNPLAQANWLRSDQQARRRSTQPPAPRHPGPGRAYVGRDAGGGVAAAGAFEEGAAEGLEHERLARTGGPEGPATRRSRLSALPPPESAAGDLAAQDFQSGHAVGEFQLCAPSTGGGWRIGRQKP